MSNLAISHLAPDVEFNRFLSAELSEEEEVEVTFTISHFSFDMLSIQHI